MTYTRWGREIFAIGGARNEAIAAGVPRVRPLTVAFAISAGCASLAGALAAARGGSAAPQNYEDLLLVRLRGGAAGRHQPLWRTRHGAQCRLGVAILSVVAAGLAARGSEASLVQLVTGALLFAIIALEFLAGRKRWHGTVFGTRSDQTHLRV